MFCNQYGNKLEENDKFCGKCGTEVLRNTDVTNSKSTMDVRENEVNCSTKKSSNSKIFLIIILILLVLIGVRSVGFISKISSSGNTSYSKSSKKAVTKVVKLENIRLEYNNQDWDSTNSNSYDYRELRSDNGKIGIFVKSKYILDYLNLEQYLNEFKNTCTAPCEIIENIQTMNINGNTWYKFGISRNGYNNLYLYYTNGINTYIVIYSAKLSNYDNEISKVEKVLSTIKFSESD